MAKLKPQARKAPAPAAEEPSPSSASAAGARAPASPLLDLQRSAGNELTGRMIGGLLVQAKLRNPAGSEAPSSTEASVESLPGSATPPSETPAEPNPETPAAETGPAAELVVDDSAETAGPGQMKKSEFFARLRAEVCAAAEAGLAGTEHSAQGCPLIEFWLGYYEEQDTERINRDLPRFAGEGPRPTTAEGYIALITSRVRTSVETWARTGEVTGVPPGLPLPGMGLPGLGALGGLLGGLGGLGGPGVFFKAGPGGPRDPGDPRDLQAQLGDGRPLDGAVRSRMESVFGRGFSQVRVHTDGGAAGLASRLNARAFTVGEHVAFGAREYRPGTLVGDALLAHELAHVAQQGSGDAGAGPSGYQALERDADLAAAGATVSLWSGLRSRLRPAAQPAPRLTSGLRLQRCRSCAQTREEAVLDKSPVPQQLLAASGFDRFLPAFEAALAQAADLQTATRVVDTHGRGLWQAATQRSQATGNPDTDDRPLYWARLQMTRALRRWGPSFSLDSADREALIQRFERASRGVDTATFQPRAGVKRILISGFDPFALDPRDPSRGNASGAAVLALDGTTVTNGGVSGEIQGAVFPVRFADFDAGMVESFFGPFLSGPNPAHMIMTISQGSSALFEAEQFAGRRRSTPAPDNPGELSGGTKAAPVEPPGLAPGPEFLETKLPTATIRSTLGQTSPLPQETEFEEQVPSGAPPTPGRPNPLSTSVEGSGGGYLSNEIFYRTLLLRRQNGATIPVGHLHTPYMDPESGFSSPQAFQQERDRIIDTVKAVLRDVLPTLGP